MRFLLCLVLMLLPSMAMAQQRVVMETHAFGME